MHPHIATGMKEFRIKTGSAPSSYTSTHCHWNQRVPHKNGQCAQFINIHTLPLKWKRSAWKLAVCPVHIHPHIATEMKEFRIKTGSAPSSYTSTHCHWNERVPHKNWQCTQFIYIHTLPLKWKSSAWKLAVCPIHIHPHIDTEMKEFRIKTDSAPSSYTSTHCHWNERVPHKNWQCAPFICIHTLPLEWKSSA